MIKVWSTPVLDGYSEQGKQFRHKLLLNGFYVLKSTFSYVAGSSVMRYLELLTMSNS